MLYVVLQEKSELTCVLLRTLSAITTPRRPPWDRDTYSLWVELLCSRLTCTVDIEVWPGITFT